MTVPPSLSSHNTISTITNSEGKRANAFLLPHYEKKKKKGVRAGVFYPPLLIHWCAPLLLSQCGPYNSRLKCRKYQDGMVTLMIGLTCPLGLEKVIWKNLYIKKKKKKKKKKKYKRLGRNLFPFLTTHGRPKTPPSQNIKPIIIIIHTFSFSSNNLYKSVSYLYYFFIIILHYFIPFGLKNVFLVQRRNKKNCKKSGKCKVLSLHF